MRATGYGRRHGQCCDLPCSQRAHAPPAGAGSSRRCPPSEHPVPPDPTGGGTRAALTWGALLDSSFTEAELRWAAESLLGAVAEASAGGGAERSVPLQRLAGAGGALGESTLCNLPVHVSRDASRLRVSSCRRGARSDHRVGERSLQGAQQHERWSRALARCVEALGA